MRRAITLDGPIPVAPKPQRKKRRKKTRVLRYVRDTRGLQPRWYDNPQDWTLRAGPSGRIAWHYNGPPKE